MRPRRHGSGTRGRHLAGVVAAASLVFLLAAAAGVGRVSADTSGVSTPPSASLWPKFSTPQLVLAANTAGISGADLLTAVTLQGVYNGEQQPSRLYLIQRPEDQFWLTQLPPGIRVDTLAPPSGESLLQMLLERFRPFIRGAIVTDPSNADTDNLATTMAGLDHAIVINPSQESLASSLGIPVLYSFDTATFTADDPAQTYEWGIQNLLAQSSTRLLVMLSGTEYGDIRDYTVATGSFIFWLTSTNAAEEPVMNTIIEHTPANTPIMGYVPDENPDVADLSSLGHFLNASDQLTNESFWASIPSPPALHEATQPAPLAARPNTVYVAFLASDGDNAQYMQHEMAELWSGSDLGAVPMGWTVAPGTVYFDPTMLEYYTRNLPADSELDAGPSGIGYASEMTGSDLTTFAQLTGEILAKDGLHSTDSYEPPTDQSQFVQAAKPPIVGISQSEPLVEEQLGHTVLFGQTSGYLHTPQDLFCAIHQQTEDLQAQQPLFLEPLYQAPDITLPQLLETAQSLALAAQSEGFQIVFTTPSELELTMEHYFGGEERGLPAANVQSMTGAQVLAEPTVTPTFPTGTVQITGPNLLTNPSGASGTLGWGTSGGDLSATTYQGQPALHWTSDVISGLTYGLSYAYSSPAITKGDTYTFSMQVAGSGQVYMDVYNGSVDNTTLPVKLTSSYQTLTWTETIPTNAPNSTSIQLREVGTGPASAYIRDASVSASTSAC